jgi:23S rRNA (uridine2552-2'-O)-methyltransferase
MTIDPAQLRGDLPAFDVVLSDMAPDTTGIRHLDQARSEALFERAFELATLLLAPGGNFVGKLFQGPDFKKLIEAVRGRFSMMKTAKPASSRQISIEQYVVGKGFRGS